MLEPRWPEFSWLVAGLSALWAIVVVAVGNRLTVIDEWYFSLKKPEWKPPDWAFGLIWTIIFILSATALYRGWMLAPDAATRAVVITLFVVNGALNVAWNVLFFTWRRPDWALPETYLLIISTIAPAIYLAGFDRLAGLLLLPYIIWVCFACRLTQQIVALNRPFDGLTPQSQQ